jgi:ribonuclease VapC
MAEICYSAALTFGDCFTYALAERTGHPVLCTGDDFAATGISVLRPPAAGDGKEPLSP